MPAVVDTRALILDTISSKSVKLNERVVSLGLKVASVSSGLIKIDSPTAIGHRGNDFLGLNAERIADNLNGTVESSE